MMQKLLTMLLKYKTKLRAKFGKIRCKSLLTFYRNMTIFQQFYQDVAHTLLKLLLRCDTSVTETVMKMYTLLNIFHAQKDA